MTILTTDYSSSKRITADLWIKDPSLENNSAFDKTTIINTTVNEEVVNIRIDWCKYSYGEIDDFKSLKMPEDDYLRIAGRFCWAIVDLKRLAIIKIEECLQFWAFEKHQNCIVVITELEVISLNFKGKTIDKAPIDPPWKMEEYKDKIIFTSQVFGKQTLLLG